MAFGKTGLDVTDINLLHNAAFFAFLAAFAFGSSTVFGKRIVNHLDYKATAALRFGITGIMAFVVVIFSNNLASIRLIDGAHWWYLILIVFSSGAAAMFIYYYGLKRVTASTATICELFWPFSAVILDYFLNKNILNSVQIFASLILLFAFYKVVTTGQRKKIEFTAKRIDGAGRGGRLGFPTINLDKIDLDVDHGVYLVKAKINERDYQGLLHFGHRVTFGDQPSLELYVKERLENISDNNVRVEIIKKIREVRKFNTEEELKEQINKDVEMLGD
ncbi:MAG: riboflavin kinase [Patescibacteria group bacterium]|nr:riboflavin kinase [Patescibacteria group bacterium]